ncbi:MAG TPA: DUF2240 family protein [Methanocorpusculum sp.]|nr:DUF2240 family protein [Methanocorpusculum sp.]
MGELEITLAAPFIHMRSPSLSQMKLVFYYTQDKRWMGLDDAKKLITIGLTAGILTKDEHGEFVLTESLRDEKVPLGFRPTDEIFSAPLPEKKDVLDTLLAEVSAKSGLETKQLVSELSEIRAHFDNLIGDYAAITLLAKKYGVDVTPHRTELLAQIES